MDPLANTNPTSPPINANNVAANQLDPQLAQAILTKVAGGQALTPDEKVAAGKLPPSVLAHAALSGTAPLPENSTPDPNTFVGGPGSPSYKPPVTPPAPIPGAPQGNSAERFSTPPGATTQYNGSGQTTKMGPITPQAPPTVPPMTPTIATPAPVVAKSFQANTPSTIGTSGDTISPNAEAAQAAVNSPSTPPSLKGMTGQQIASLIANVLDAVGVGLSARGGVNRQTMLQKQMELKQQTGAQAAQAMNQAHANVAQEQGTAPIELQKQIAAMAEQARNEVYVKKQQAGVDLGNEKEMAAYNAEVQLNFRKKMLEAGIPPQGMESYMGLLTNPGQAGYNHGATIAGVGIQ